MNLSHPPRRMSSPRIIVSPAPRSAPKELVKRVKPMTPGIPHSARMRAYGFTFRLGTRALLKSKFAETARCAFFRSVT